MANKQGLNRRKKRELSGACAARKRANKESKKENTLPENSGSEFLESELVEGQDSEEESGPDLNKSASEEKIGGNLEEYKLQLENFASIHGFVLIDSSILCAFMDKALSCELCSGLLNTSVEWDNHRGYAVTFVSICEHCHDKKSLFTSSKPCQQAGILSEKSHTPFEVNARIVTFIREVGKCQNALQKFSTIMNTPSIGNASYNSLVNELHDACLKQATASMDGAAEVEKEEGEDDCTIVSIGAEMDWSVQLVVFLAS